MAGGGMVYIWISKKTQTARENVVWDKAADLGKVQTLKGLVHNIKGFFILRDVIRFYSRLTWSDVHFEKIILATE